MATDNCALFPLFVFVFTTQDSRTDGIGFKVHQHEKSCDQSREAGSKRARFLCARQTSAQGEQSA